MHTIKAVMDATLKKKISRKEDKNREDTKAKSKIDKDNEKLRT